MPHLVEMHKELSKKGLKLIALEAQGSSKEEIAKIVKEQDMTFPVAKIGKIPGVKIEGIPHMAVYDTKGKLIWTGNPGRAEDVIKKALRSVKSEDSSSSGLDVFAKKKDLVEERDWTRASDGRKLKAALVSLEQSKGTFRRSSGKTFTYDITQLSDDDQSLIKEKTSDEGDDDEEADSSE